MPLTSMPDHIRGVIDPETNSRLNISSTPEIDTLIVKFEWGSVALRTAIYIKSKFPDRPLVNNDQTNPRVMISAGDMNVTAHLGSGSGWRGCAAFSGAPLQNRG